MFTARAQESDEKLGLECGANAYITKPFEPQILLDKIKELLEKPQCSVNKPPLL
jgi:DNA-binding response OmpR family regulator